MTARQRLRLAVLSWQLACTMNFALFSALFMHWDIDYMAQVILWTAYLMFSMTHGIVYILFWCMLREK